MSLSCSCDFDLDQEPGDWSYWFIDKDVDFEVFKMLRAKRCCSCNQLIGYGDICVKFKRYRYPYNEIESRITGMAGDYYWDEFNDEPNIPMADHYHCECCGEIFFNLTELGFECLSPNENMLKSLEEYKEL